MADFGGALALLRRAVGPFDVVLPTLPHIEDEVRARAAAWPVDAAHRARRSGEIRGVPHRARGARRLRHRDARACARRRSDGRRLQGRARRGAAQISRSRSPRSCCPTSSSASARFPEMLQTRLHARGARRGARRAIMRDGPARGAARRAARLDAADARLPTAARRAPMRPRAVLETIGAARGLQCDAEARRSLRPSKSVRATALGEK